MMLTRRSFVGIGAAAALPASVPKWEKKGLILKPGFAGTRSADLLSAPSVVMLPDERLRLYFWGRGNAHCYIYAVEASPSNPMQWELVKPQPMLTPAPAGTMNNVGPGFPFVLPRDDGPWLMYYCSWGSWAPKGKISNRTCLALSYDAGMTWTVAREPLLPLGKPGSFDGGLTGSVYVMRTGKSNYQMWYTAGGRYEMIGPINRAIANIGYATSTNGIEWKKHPEAVMTPREKAVKPYEAVVSKPSVLRLNGKYHMWLSVFCMEDRGYRIEYAQSEDGVRWRRSFDEEVLPPTPGGFDSANQSYANVIEQGEELWMFYTGNGFGRTGIGLATLRKSNLRG
jgi:hypothetical protein